MTMNIFDAIGWVIEKCFQLLNALFSTVMALLSTVAKVIFTPLSWVADFFLDHFHLPLQWAFPVIWCVAALVLLLLIAVGLVLIAAARRRGGK